MLRTAFLMSAICFSSLAVAACGQPPPQSITGVDQPVRTDPRSEQVILPDYSLVGQRSGFATLQSITSGQLVGLLIGSDRVPIVKTEPIMAFGGNTVSGFTLTQAAEDTDRPNVCRRAHHHYRMVDMGPAPRLDFRGPETTSLAYGRNPDGSCPHGYAGVHALTGIAVIQAIDYLSDLRSRNNIEVRCLPVVIEHSHCQATVDFARRLLRRSSLFMAHCKPRSAVLNSCVQTRISDEYGWTVDMIGSNQLQIVEIVFEGRLPVI